MRRLRNARRTGEDGERGAIMVEVTMIVPVLVLIVLGMLEMGMAWRDKVTVTQASRQGARVASHLGSDYQADREALRNLFSVFDGDSPGRIQYVVIYDASATDGSLPAGCNLTPAGPHTNCNFYTLPMLQELDDDSKWNAADNCPDSSRYDAGWCPSDRDDALLTPDHVGVMVQVNRDWVTNIFPTDGTTVTSDTVMRVEPEAS